MTDEEGAAGYCSFIDRQPYGYESSGFLICSFREFTANELHGTIIVPERFDLFD